MLHVLLAADDARLLAAARDGLATAEGIEVTRAGRMAAVADMVRHLQPDVVLVQCDEDEHDQGLGRRRQPGRRGGHEAGAVSGWSADQASDAPATGRTSDEDPSGGTDSAATLPMVRLLALERPVAMLATRVLEAPLERVAGLGASGMLTPDLPAHAWGAAVRLLASGATVFAPVPPGAARDSPTPAGGRGRSMGASSAPSARLSPRERDVLALLVSGLTNAEIAHRLYLSPTTVKGYVSAVYRKLAVTNRVEAVTRARVEGIVPS